MKKRILAMLIAVALFVAASIITNAISANATNKPCIPRDAWVETIEHPAVMHEVLTAVVDEEAWTEVIEATPDLWWNWSPNDTQAPQDYEPAFPVDERGTWQGPHANGGPNQDTYGTFQTSAPGNSNWFHREQGVAEQVIEHAEVVHGEVTIVVDEEAWTETVEHPAVTCTDPEDPTDDPEEPTDDPEEPTDPVVPPEDPQEPKRPPVVTQVSTVSTQAAEQTPVRVDAGL